MWRVIRCRFAAGVTLAASILAVASVAHATTDVTWIKPVTEAAQQGDSTAIMVLGITSAMGSGGPWAVVALIGYQMVGVIKRAEDMASRLITVLERLVEEGVTHHHIDRAGDE